MISESDRQALLAVARDAVVSTVTGSPRSPSEPRADLSRPGAAFVSLHVGGQLRGCIGHLDENDPLVETVAECARLACTEDPRFPAVTVAEIDALDIEISVLGTFQRVTSIDEIIVGRDGLLVELNGRRGLLLPQVATEYGWSAQTFVEQTCHKAGVPRDAWQRGATLYRFEAEVFGGR